MAFLHLDSQEIDLFYVFYEEINSPSILLAYFEQLTIKLFGGNN